MATWCMMMASFCGRFVIGDIFLGVSSASMFEPSVLFFVSSNMLMLPTVMPISETITYLLKFDGSLVGIPVMNSPKLLSLRGGYGGCTISFFVRFVVHLLVCMGWCFPLPLVGAGVHGSPLWDCCLLAGDCWGCVWRLFPVMMGIARDVQPSNSTSC